jgi:hypothetical protein
MRKIFARIIMTIIVISRTIEKKRQNPGGHGAGVRDEILKQENVQKNLEEEKLKLDKQGLEISSKIKALKKTGVTNNLSSLNGKAVTQEDDPTVDKSEKERQYGVLEVQTAEKKRI